MEATLKGDHQMPVPDDPPRSLTLTLEERWWLYEALRLHVLPDGVAEAMDASEIADFAAGLADVARTMLALELEYQDPVTIDDQDHLAALMHAAAQESLYRAEEGELPGRDAVVAMNAVEAKFGLDRRLAYRVT